MISPTIHPGNLRNVASRRGAALLAVIWLIGILGIATMAALRVITFDMQIASAKVHGSRARQIAEKGIAVGANPAVERWDPILRQMDGETGEGFEARIISEGGRFSINAILLKEDKALLRAIFEIWGLEFDQAQALADALGDWVDEDDNVALNGAEKPDYEKLGRINQPFNRLFYSLDEMRLVLGMDRVEALRPDWRDWFTVWSGGMLDINEASAELIAIAAECSVEQATRVTEQIPGPDGVRDTEDDTPFENTAAALDLLGIDANASPDLANRFTVEANTIRIESIGQVQGAKRKITVIIRNRNGNPLLLDRTEEIIP